MKWPRGGRLQNNRELLSMSSTSSCITLWELPYKTKEELEKHENKFWIYIHPLLQVAEQGEFPCFLLALPYPASKGCELIVKFSSTSSSLGGNYLSLKSANFPIRVSVCTCDLEIINTWYNIKACVKANGRRTNFLGMKMACLVSPELYYCPFSIGVCCVGCSSIYLD